jgi:hypothetical protein
MHLRNEHLSDVAIELVGQRPDAYRELVVQQQGPGAVEERLASEEVAHLFRGPIVRPAMADAVRCGLWLWHDFLEPAHHLAQADQTVTGSLWHAIMHRREGDFSNSRYWYAKCRQHFILGPLAQHVQAMINPLPADKRLLKLTFSGWNADAFVELVEAVHDAPGDPLRELCIEIQQLEWRLLLEHCAAQAVEG